MKAMALKYNVSHNSNILARMIMEINQYIEKEKNILNLVAKQL